MGKRVRCNKVVVDIKLSYEQVSELLLIYTWHIDHFKWDDLAELLLLEHMKDMHYRLAVVEGQMDKKASLSLNNTEALAFYLFWNITDTSKWPLANVILCNLIKKIDKQVKAPKLL